MQFSFLHLLIVAILVVLLFGRGEISGLMGDVAAGIKNFKKGLKDDDTHVTRVVSTQDINPAPEVKQAGAPLPVNAETDKSPL